MRVSSVLLAVVCLLLSCSFLGCGKEPAPGPMAMEPAEMERWEIALVEWRIEKNEDFMDGASTPLPETLRPGFEGLDYYFPAAEFRFRLPLVKAAHEDTVMLTKRKGDQVPYVVVGTVNFRHNDADHALTVYGPARPGPFYHFLPFSDLTNGETTYPGGRYIDLELDADGMVELDFNKSYNPLCAYNPDGFNCTQPPPENRLGFRVEAGEKLLTGATH